MGSPTWTVTGTGIGIGTKNQLATNQSTMPTRKSSGPTRGARDRAQPRRQNCNLLSSQKNKLNFISSPFCGNTGTIGTRALIATCANPVRLAGHSMRYDDSKPRRASSTPPGITATHMPASSSASAVPL
eukprot:Amastigsp_a519814_8.p4 type:complete len:129 gc:universal Amastigsp_a519814_8:212-598(+)